VPKDALSTMKKYFAKIRIQKLVFFVNHNYALCLEPNL
jgi:hypothetical protein